MTDREDSWWVRALTLAWVGFSSSADTWVVGFSGLEWVDRIGLAVILPLALLLVLGIAANLTQDHE